jgi:hypothetical protein
MMEYRAGNGDFIQFKDIPLYLLMLIQHGIYVVIRIVLFLIRTLFRLVMIPFGIVLDVFLVVLYGMSVLTNGFYKGLNWVREHNVIKYGFWVITAVLAWFALFQGAEFIPVCILAAAFLLIGKLISWGIDFLCGELEYRGYGNSYAVNKYKNIMRNSGCPFVLMLPGLKAYRDVQYYSRLKRRFNIFYRRYNENKCIRYRLF